MKFDDYVNRTVARMSEDDAVQFLLNAMPDITDYAIHGATDAECLDNLTRVIRPADAACDCRADTLRDFAEGTEICTRCGIAATFITNAAEGEYIAHVGPPKTGYNRINHFNEFMARFVGVEKTAIPPAVIEDVRNALNGKRPDMATIRDALRRIKKPKYYENWVQICKRLHGLCPPSVDGDLYERLRSMFGAAQGAFYHSKDIKRKNFFSYSYFVHKSCELLGYIEFLPFLPLLKCPKKLVEQDAMWKALCVKLNWKFIPSTRQ